MIRAACLIAAVVGLGWSGLARATTLPAGFEERTIVSGLDKPIAIAWAPSPDGRLFIAQQPGQVEVVDGNGQKHELLDISDHVNSYSDRGLLGIALDANFASNHYLYLLYTHETAPSDPTGAKSSRLARVVVNADNTAGPETVLLGTDPRQVCPAPDDSVDCIPSDGDSHSIGTVRADADGTLWVGSGDAADYATANAMALRAYNTASMAGKILHVDGNGRGLAGHPFCPTVTDLAQVCTKLYAIGFRNPFRFVLRSGTGPQVGDVGWNTREELDLVEPGKNYGWPCYEGTIHTPTYQDHSDWCGAEYAKEQTSDPSDDDVLAVYDYPHVQVPGQPYMGGAVIAGPTYQGTGYPGGYRGSLFFGDYVLGYVKRLELDANGRPKLGGDGKPIIDAFATDIVPVDLELAPDGNLAYVDPGQFAPGQGAVKEIVYTPGNRSPVAVVDASPTSGSAPLTVQFNGSASSDGDSDPLTFDWDFGDGSAHSTQANPQHTYQAGSYTARLTVSDGRGGSGSETIAIVSGNHAPTASILAPSDNSFYRDGATIDLRGSGTDVEDTNAALTWRVVLHHGSHVHPLQDLAGQQASFVARTDHDADSYYDITLIATDSGGATDTKTIRINPETASLTLASSPPGAAVSYGGSGGVAPWTQTSAIGFITTISATDRFDAGGRSYAFESWSDGGARVHDVTVPASATTVTAVYRDVTPAPPPALSSPPVAPAVATPSPLGLPASNGADRSGPVVTLDRKRIDARRGHISGLAYDATGVRGVWIALRAQQRSRSLCRWLEPRGRGLRTRSCRSPRWIAAGLRRRRSQWDWLASLGARLPAGRYVISARATDTRGNKATGFAGGVEEIPIVVRSARTRR